MPFYTVINPLETPLSLPYGDFEPDVLYRNVELTNPQLRNAVNSRGLIALAATASEQEIARIAFTLIGVLGLPGFRTPSEREQYRSKAGLQEWQTLLALLDKVD